MEEAATLKAMGDDATGIAVSQVVPLPGNTVVPLVRECRQVRKPAGTTLQASQPHAKHFMESAWSMKRQDFGGLQVNFTDSASSASRFVDSKWFRLTDALPDKQGYTRAHPIRTYPEIVVAKTS